MAKKTLTTYISLRSAVRKTLGQQEGDGGPKRIARYKRIGELIDSHVLLHAERATYGSEVIQRLSGDLAVGYQRLYEMLNVYRAYPIFRSTGNLSWTHYVTLATIEDGQVRAAYEAQAVRGAWSGRELRDRIKEGLLQDADGHLVADWNGSLPPTPRRGQPYTYRVKEARSNSLLLDLGMGAEHEIDLKRPTPFEAGDVVTTQSDGKLYTIQPGDSRRLYTFKASVERVVDGDTFWVKVDYGFKFRQPVKIRLRGIDSAELSTVEGVRAKVWVGERLSAVPFVVITTMKVGMYGRYIADVFYGGGRSAGTVAERGRYLNAEMVEEGVAVGLG